MSEVALTLSLVAVLVAACGVAHLPGEALASLQAQAMPDWECGVIDDRAPAFAASTAAQFLTDPRNRFPSLDKIAARALI
jgi:hypothetical protein